MATVQHEPARAGVTEIRVHGVGGTSPVAMLGRSDLVQVAGDETSGFYRVADADGWRTVEAYSWGGLTAKSATRALWTLLLPFSLVNIAGWMIEPVRERTARPGRGPFGTVDRALARLGRRLSGRAAGLRGFQEWLVHLLALVFTATYIQLSAYLSADLFALQCGSNIACRERIPLSGLLGADLEVGRRLVIGTALPLALLMLFLYLARNSRLTYESFKPQVEEIKPAGATPLEDARIWDRAKYQKVMARLHAVACLGVLMMTFAGTVLLLAPEGWRRLLYRGAVGAGVLFAAGSFLLVGWVASRRDRSGSLAASDELEKEENEKTEERIYVTANRTSAIALWVVLAIFVVQLVVTWPVRSGFGADDVVTWFATAPLWLLVGALVVGVVISFVQVLRWVAESYLHSEQLLVVIAALVVALFPYPPVLAAVAVILVAANVAVSLAEERTGALLDLVVLTVPALVGFGLSLGIREQAYLWLGVALSAVAAGFLWLARRPEPGFRWAGTGAIGAFAATILLGIFSGLIVRTALWLSANGFTISYPDFYQWAVVVVTVGLALVVMALLLYGARSWWANRSEWRSVAEQRLRDAGYPDEAAEGVAASTVLFRSIVETARVVDVMVTLAGIVIFTALLSRVIDIFFRDRSTRDWFPDSEPAWVLLLDVSSWLALATIVAAYLAVRSAIRSEATRRKIGMVWDVASFFPRSFHPLAPPAYAARAVPEIQARVTETVNSGNSVILAGHSQGSVIVAAVMASMPAEIRANTALVTYGSPIGKFYRPFFPAAFPDTLVHSLAETVGPRAGSPEVLFWINFYRPTDPIAAPALKADELEGMSVPKLSAVALEVRGRSADRCDVLLEDPWETRLRYYRPIPQIKGHSGYESDPAWAAGVQSLATLLGRARTVEELVVLVDEADVQIGTAEKISAHQEGLLHRAVSVFVFDSRNRLLIQLRAQTKHIFRGLWANTSCTHPRPDESLIEAGRRSLLDELGIDTELIELGAFTYRKADPATGLSEAEIDHVLIGMAEIQPEPNPEEVTDYQWVDLADLRQRMSENPEEFVPWLGPALSVLVSAGVIAAQ